MRIKPPKDYPPADADKRPFVVIDPRAGHGPGIGGFKIDSEIGIALKFGASLLLRHVLPAAAAGPDHRIGVLGRDRVHAQVRELHPDPDNKPFVIGNCQGGWALMMLAALAPDLVGPILLAGSPLSYWAGVGGKNPMRYTGGPARRHLALVAHRRISATASSTAPTSSTTSRTSIPRTPTGPSSTTSIPRSTPSGQRFLEFEKWWGGHYLLNKEEMEWIAQNLFVGNKLAAGEVESFDGKHRVDIRNIRSPIMVFASWGDNITPPQQALNWIPDLYASVDEIRLNEQTIVYCLHEKIGHLGIFVSASVAKRETASLPARSS